MSNFDPQALIESVTTSSMETEYSPIPEGEYLGVIVHTEDKPLSVRRVVVDESSGKTAFVLDVNIKIDAPGNEEADGKYVRYSAWLDLTPEGAFEQGKNKNVKLGLLREAVGQNIPNQEWGIKMLANQPLKVSVKIDKSGRYSNVESVAKAA